MMRKFDHVSVEYDREEEVLIWKIKDTGIPNFCLQGLQEFQEFCDWVQEYFSHPERPLKFIVSGSEYRGVYNMGGDLAFFLDCINTQNVEKLTMYAHLCIDAIYNIYASFGLPAITIALVEGNAYGGGFECALAHDFIIAEEGVQFCLPENKFNLFPGMGAYSLLMRKLSKVDADTLIRGGDICGAEYLQTLGLVERVTQKDVAILELHRFADLLRERFNFEYHHVQCKKAIDALSKAELLDITNLWVDACMNIREFDLRKMEILVKAQSRKVKMIH